EYASASERDGSGVVGTSQIRPTRRCDSSRFVGNDGGSRLPCLDTPVHCHGSSRSALIAAGATQGRPIPLTGASFAGGDVIRTVSLSISAESIRFRARL